MERTYEPVVRNTCLREPHPPVSLPCLSRVRPSIRDQTKATMYYPSVTVHLLSSIPRVFFLLHLFSGPPPVLGGNEQIKAAPLGASSHLRQFF